MSELRYRVGCPGMFALSGNWVVDFTDELDALAHACTIKAGEVLDTRTGRWSAPECWEDVVEIEGRWRARDAARREVAEALR